MRLKANSRNRPGGLSDALCAALLDPDAVPPASCTPAQVESAFWALYFVGADRLWERHGEEARRRAALWHWAPAYPQYAPMETPLVYYAEMWWQHEQRYRHGRSGCECDPCVGVTTSR